MTDDITNSAPTKTRARKSRRAGQLIRRGDNKWLIRVYAGRDSEGKRSYHNKTFLGTKKEAERWLTGALTRLEHGQPFEEYDQSFAAWLDEWLKIKAREVKPRTMELYEDWVNRVIKPALGKHRLTSIKAAHILTLYGDLEERGISGRTLQLVHAIITNAFRKAIRMKRLRENPMMDIDRPRSAPREMMTLTPEQVKAFRQAVEQEKYGCALTFLIATGCRPGEVLALKWSDINWQQRAVTIQRNLVRLKGGRWQLDDPKTPRGRRSLKLTDTLLKNLQDHRRRQNEQRLKAGAAWVNNDLVFCNAFGNPPGVNELQKCSKAALKRADLPTSFRVYDGRHTTASLLMFEGVSPKVVSERLGHSNINITLEVYSHILPGMQEEASEKLDRLVFGS